MDKNDIFAIVLIILGIIELFFSFKKILLFHILYVVATFGGAAYFHLKRPVK